MRDHSAKPKDYGGSNRERALSNDIPTTAGAVPSRLG